MPDDKTLLFSLKPVYAELLLSGRKTVELRRSRPRIPPGTKVLLYSSSPDRALVGTARIVEIEADAPAAIWQRHGAATGLRRAEFDSYFQGAATAVAIVLTEVRRLERSVPLRELRRRLRDFRPPQSFAYLQAAQAASVT